MLLVGRAPRWSYALKRLAWLRCWSAPAAYVSRCPRALLCSSTLALLRAPAAPRLQPVSKSCTVHSAAGGEGNTRLPIEGQTQTGHGNVVDVCIEGGLPDFSMIEELATSVEGDGSLLLEQIQAMHSQTSEPMELSVVLCDDAHIAELNREYRGKDGPTDVLSFETESPPGYPLHLLGDVVISLETAQQQASERGHSLQDECRVLLVHGVLHLLGHDHEQGEQASEDMAQQEQRILAALGWRGQGLIAASEAEGDVHSGEMVESAESTSTAGQPTFTKAASLRGQTKRGTDIRLLALDMDGTLLNSQSKVLPSSVDALRAALALGVTVCLATGKARPAAISAMAKVGLAGDNLVVSSRGPGLFLQGLAVHGKSGNLLEGPDMPAEIVRAAFEYAEEQAVPLAAFLGDECATLKMHPELEELHYRYYEPLCKEVSSLDALLAGLPVKKLLFMTSAEAITEQHRPFWQDAVLSRGADTTMAVPNMLEIVPQGINKWVGMQLLLRDLGMSADNLMSCGDGSNDLQLVANSGLGIAMGNAVPQVKQAAKVVVASNDDGGIAEAIERFIL